MMRLALLRGTASEPSRAKYTGWLISLLMCGMEVYR